MNSDPHGALDAEAHRKAAVALFNYVWTLLDRKDRTTEDDDEMIRAAYASRWHWGVVGSVLNHARGEWQIARCCAEAGHPAAALHHGACCLATCEREDLGVFDTAFANEAMARALVVAGDPQAAGGFLEEARRVGADIEKDEDRNWLEENLNEVHARMAHD